MMRRQRKATPLIALLLFEVVAIVGLHILGSASSMQVPWGSELSPWLQQSSVDEIAAPIVRLLALVIAYWMLASTSLFALAQISRIPAAIRATSMLTLPSVRRVCEGAVAVSLVTTSFVGMAGGVASAQGSGDILDLSNPAPAQGIVDSPTSKAADPNAATTTTTAAPTTTTSAAPTTTTTGAPSTTTTAAASGNNAAVAPSAGDDFVSSPRPGQPATTTTTTAAPAPQAPAEQPKTDVMGAQEHKVVAGDNLWTISRQALADSSNRNTKDVSEAEVRDYWLKVIDENRSKLRSGDPHWIFPGEVISLPTN